MTSIDKAMRDDSVNLFLTNNYDEIKKTGLALMVSSYFATLTCVANSVKTDPNDLSLLFSSLVFSSFSVYAALSGAAPRVKALKREYDFASNYPEKYISMNLESQK